jgi:DNA uptake protein ComE-like DNA-binding protein
MARLRAAIGGEPAPQEFPGANLTKPAPLPPQPVAGAPKPAFDLRTLPGVDDKLARAMEDAKFGTLASLQNTTPEKLAEVPGMGGKLAIKVLAYVNENFPKGV